VSGGWVSKFFPANSTCQFSEFVRFVEFRKPVLGKVHEAAVADNPEAIEVTLSGSMNQTVVS
jgi:hypothetical protein